MIDWPTMRAGIRQWITTGTGLPLGKVVLSQQGAPRPANPWVEFRIATVNNVGRDEVRRALNPLTLADDDVDAVDVGNDRVTVTGHAYVNGDGPVRLTTTGTLPAGLDVGVDYFIIVIDANTVAFAATHPNVYVPTPVTITDVGSGVHTIVDTPTTVRAGSELTFTQVGWRNVVVTMQAFADAPDDARDMLESLVGKSQLPGVNAALYASGFSLASFDAVTTIDGVVGSTDFEPRAVLTARGFATSTATEAGTFIEYAELENTDEATSTFIPSDPTP